jgi:energy-coupling factor transporter ATP-binding protein EcfA2
MQVSISNFRGISEAQFSTSKIALIAGLNGQGKTSIAQAVAAALTNTPLPGEVGLRKGEGIKLVHKGSESGYVKIWGNDFESRMFWPDGDCKTTGSPPKVSKIAAGIARVAEMKEKDRGAVLSEYLKSSPTKDDLKSELERLDKILYLDNLWKEIDGRGWDDVYKTTAEKSVKAKGAWEQITGERYGSVKALTWKPKEGYELPINGKETLVEQFGKLHERLESAIKRIAIADHDKKSLEDAVASIPGLETDLQSARIVQTEKENALDKFKAKNQRPFFKEQTHCPHCGCSINVSGDKVFKAEDIKQDADEIAAKQKDYDAQLSSFKEDFEQAYADRAAIEANLVNARVKKLSLEKINEADSLPSGNPEIIRSDIALIEQEIKDYDRYTEAMKLHNLIADASVLAGILAPDGLRLKKLSQVLSTFNAILSGFCAAAQWGSVKVSDNLDITFCDRDYELLSKSEKFRVNVALQVCLSGIDGSELIIIDEADVLDQKGRNGLFGSLSTLCDDKEFIVCMTITTPPDLEASGLGVTYWVQSGKVVPLKDKALAA